MSIVTGTTYQSIVGEVIAQERKLQGLSQGQLADMLETSQSAWSRVESGLTNLSIEQLVKVAKALDIKPHVLIGKADAARLHFEQNDIPVADGKANHTGWLLLGAAALAATILIVTKGK